MTLGVGSGIFGFAGVALNAVVFDGRAARSSNGMFAKVEARPRAARTRMRMEMGWSSGLGPGRACDGTNGC